MKSSPPTLRESLRAVPRWIFFGAVGVVLLAVSFGGAMFSYVRRPSTPGVPIDARAPLPDYVPPAHLVPGPVQVQILNLPEGAEIFVDGRMVADNPFEVSRGIRHIVDLRAAGYVAQQLQFTLDNDTRFQANLQRATNTNERVRLTN